MVMPFEKDHKYYPPKNGKKPGRKPDMAKAMRNFAIAVRERVNPDAYIDFQLAVIAGKDPKVIEVDGELRVTFDERGGIVPTLEQKQKAWENLMNRGYGLPAQQHVITGEIQHHLNALGEGINYGLLSPSATEDIRARLRRELESKSSAVDAEIVSETPASTDGTADDNE